MTELLAFETYQPFFMLGLLKSQVTNYFKGNICPHFLKRLIFLNSNLLVLYNKH